VVHAAPIISIGPLLAPPWQVTWGTGVGWGAALGVGEGLDAGLGLAVAIVGLGVGEGEMAAVGADAPQAVTNTANTARPFSFVTQEA
jgi:hypothetical protein